MILLLFGPPGSGKGTQARLLSEHLRIPSVSTGELLRAAANSETSLGRQLRETLAAGQYVNDETVNEIVLDRLDRVEEGGLILDGYPRTVEQALFLEAALAKRGFAPPSVVHLEVPPEVIVRRLTSRAQCPQCNRIHPRLEGDCEMCHVPLSRRDDDEAEVVTRRLETYHARTGPVLAHYASGHYLQVDGNMPPAMVFDRIRAAISPNCVNCRTNGARQITEK